MLQIPHRTSQRHHRGINFCELVEARDDPPVILQSTEHALDDIALPILGSITQPRQAWLGIASWI